jgi:hypothetical protein
MALIYNATVTPTKLELLAKWLPTQSWFAGDPAAELENVAAFRFDDPDGEVGVETVLVFRGNRTMQVPLTYRATPLVGGEAHLIGVMDHSVLGARYTYDGLGDPVYLATLASAVLGGGHQAEENVQTDNGLVPRTPRASVIGSGSEPVGIAPADIGTITLRQEKDVTVTEVVGLRIAVIRVLHSEYATDSDASSLTGTWAREPDPTTLATVTRLS